MNEEILEKINELLKQHLNKVKMDNNTVRKRAPKGYVTLANGKTCIKENAIEINGFKYDKSSSEVFTYNNNYYHISDPRFIKDVLTNELIPKSRTVNLCIKIENGIPVFGNTSKYNDEYSNAQAGQYPLGIDKNGQEITAYSSKVFKDAGWGQSLNGIFYENVSKAVEVNTKIVLEKTKYTQHKNPFKNETNFNNLIDLGIKSPSYLSTNGLQYTFGVEIETSGGKVPVYEIIENKINVHTEYDGSLKNEDGQLYGGEYITGVLKGDAGMIQLNKLVKLLQRYTVINKKCSVHVHIGNAKFDKNFIVSSYILGQKIERDLFRMLPSSRSKSEYCKKMGSIDFKSMFKKYETNDAIDIAYEYLYERFLLGKKPLGKVGDRTKNHPGGRTCNHDKNSDRYCWMNLIPTVFNTRDSVNVKNIPHTIEYRAHAASLNYTKIKNWILICMALTNYAENEFDTIINAEFIKIEDVIKNVYGRNKKLTSNLLSYIADRKSLFSTDKDAEVKEYADRTNVMFNNKKELICA